MDNEKLKMENGKSKMDNEKLKMENVTMCPCDSVGLRVRYQEWGNPRYPVKKLQHIAKKSPDISPRPLYL
ncbi:MAG: hypothetical protein AB3N16_14860 [Flavobacteriaceae bacterium]